MSEELDLELEFDFDGGKKMTSHDHATIAFLEAQTDTTDAEALYRLACICYRWSQRSRQSEKPDLELKTWRYALLAAQLGHRQATTLLGQCHDLGIGTENDGDKALVCYLRAAEQGDPVAECTVANCYLVGKYVEKDQRKALQWYVRAARHGHPDAMIKLAEYHFDGVGGKLRPQLTLRWLHRAAKAGSTPAKLKLADAYFYGTCTRRDYGQYLHWVKSAAADNNYQAMQMLEYACEPIEINRWDAIDKGCPVDIFGLRFRQSTVVKIREGQTLPLDEMIRDVEERLPPSLGESGDYRYKVLDQMKRFRHGKEFAAATRH